MPLSEVIAALTVITIRIVSVKFHIHLPTLKSIGSNDQSMILILGITFFTTGWLVPATPAMAQAVTGSEHQWIRPADGNDPAIWGIRDGIVFGLWPYGIESGQDAIGGGPRGLIRVGYAAGDQVYMLNFIAVEPVVNGTMEFSEISPSQVDGKWGKLMR